MKRQFLFCLFILAIAAPVGAQDPHRVTVSGGYSFLRDSDLEENLHGWLASVGGNINDWFGIAGEVGGNYKSIDFGFGDIDLSVHSFMVGPRFGGRASDNVTAFGQLMIGGVRGSAALLGVSESTSEFAIQPGAGVDFWLQPNLGIRVGADYRRIFAEDVGLNEFRFHAGVVLGIAR